jgi:hypothetical protein
MGTFQVCTTLSVSGIVEFRGASQPEPHNANLSTGFSSARLEVDYLEEIKFDGQWKIINVLWELKPRSEQQKSSTPSQ